MEKLINKNKLNGVFRGDLLYSETSKKLYMILKLEKELYSLVNLDLGKIEYYNLTKGDVINLTNELIYIENEDCKIEIKY